MKIAFSNIKSKLKSSKLFTQLSKTSWPQNPKRLWLVLGAALVCIVALANVGLALYHQSHFYPHTKIGAVSVGGMGFDQVSKVLSNHIDRQRVHLAFDQQIKTLSPADLGASYDIEATMQAAQQLPSPILPMLAYAPWSEQRQAGFNIHLDEKVFHAKIDEILENADTEPVDAKLDIQDGKAEIIPDKPGRQYNLESVKKQIRTELGILSPTPIVVQAKTTPASVLSRDLHPALEQANLKIDTSITLAYKDKKFSPSDSEIGQWLKINQEHHITIDKKAIAAYVESIADQVDQPVVNQVITTLDGQEIDRQPGQSGLALNRTQTNQKLVESLENNQSLDYQLIVSPVEPSTEYIRKFSSRAISYNYCIAANQVSSSNLNHFSQKIISTLADPRGWGLDGRINFQQVDSGCTFTLVLAAAHTLPQYSSGCSAMWSCRVGTNVIINYDRWTGATVAWNSGGGTLNDYQSMVINHEVGHWLGFGHDHCGGAGQPAPIMQQQSIDLEGCVINTWPLARELNQLRQMKGI